MSKKVVTVHLPMPYYEALERLVKAGIYHNKAEAIKTAVKELIYRELPLIEGVEGR